MRKSVSVQRATVPLLLAATLAVALPMDHEPAVHLGAALNSVPQLTLANVLSRTEARSSLIAETIRIPTQHSEHASWEYIAPNAAESLPRSHRIGKTSYGDAIVIGGCSWTYVPSSLPQQRSPWPSYMGLCASSAAALRSRLFFPLTYMATDHDAVATNGRVRFFADGASGTVALSGGILSAASVSFETELNNEQVTETIDFRFSYRGPLAPIVPPPPRFVMHVPASGGVCIMVPSQPPPAGGTDCAPYTSR